MNNQIFIITFTFFLGVFVFHSGLDIHMVTTCGCMHVLKTIQGPFNLSSSGWNMLDIT